VAMGWEDTRIAFRIAQALMRHRAVALVVMAAVGCAGSDPLGTPAVAPLPAISAASATQCRFDGTSHAAELAFSARLGDIGSGSFVPSLASADGRALMVVTQEPTKPDNPRVVLAPVAAEPTELDVSLVGMTLQDAASAPVSLGSSTTVRLGGRLGTVIVRSMQNSPQGLNVAYEMQPGATLQPTLLGLSPSLVLESGPSGLLTHGQLRRPGSGVLLFPGVSIPERGVVPVSVILHLSGWSVQFWPPKTAVADVVGGCRPAHLPGVPSAPPPQL
jgi:hypothetical protein